MAIECLPGDPGCPVGSTALRTIPHNALLGDATIIDFGNGAAVSVPAIHIQSNGSNNGDKLYEFDGTEYLNFPAVLTTNFIAPNPGNVTLDLLLFTLDGKVNETGINARVNGLAFDDDEELIGSGAIAFDCFFFSDISAFPPNGFGPSINGGVAGAHQVGHIELFPASTSPQTDSNEMDPLTGDGNGARRRPVHGWIFQSIATAGSINGFGLGAPSLAANVAAWGRVLVSGPQALAAVGGDTPALNASPF
jgi:hypothetical protein